MAKECIRETRCWRRRRIGKYISRGGSGRTADSADYGFLWFSVGRIEFSVLMGRLYAILHF